MPQYSHGSSLQYTIGSELIGPEATATKNAEIIRSIEIVSNSNEVEIKSVEWFNKDGNNLSVVVDDSMIASAYTDGNKLNYTVKPIYNSSEAALEKNYFYAKVIYKAGSKERETKLKVYIEFVRIGDNGTNGSIFHCDIDFDYNNNIFIPYGFIGNESTNLLNADWKYYGLKKEEGEIVLDIGSVGAPAYTRLEATAAGYPSAYAFYPIDYKLEGDSFNIINIETNLPKTILYNTNGLDPSYVAESLWFKDIEINSLTCSHGAIIEDNKLILDNKREFETIVVCLNETYYFTIILLLNRYGNEAINGWDGSKLEIDEEG